MPPSKSFQLPDLLNIIEPVELRTNRHCRPATEASEQWIAAELQIVSDAERARLRAAKIGLLAALCFPACDAPQLRVLTDFMTLLFCAARAPDAAVDGRAWTSADAEAGQEGEQTGVEDGIEVLRAHPVLKHFAPSLARLMPRAPPDWLARFADAVRAFLTAQAQAERCPPPASVDAYIEMRRELHGAGAVLAVAELLQAVSVPNLHPAGAAILADLRRAALNVVACSTDVAGYRACGSRAGAGDEAGADAPTPTHAHAHNLVAVLMRSRGLSLQGAMNVCGTMIRTAFESFCATEARVLALLHPRRPAAIPVLSWVWAGAENDSDQDAELLLKEVERYTRALKDCMVGVVHWIYETELFFGKKGAEIRAFGWVFVDEELEEV